MLSGGHKTMFFGGFAAMAQYNEKSLLRVTLRHQAQTQELKKQFLCRKAQENSRKLSENIAMHLFGENCWIWS